MTTSFETRSHYLNDLIRLLIDRARKARAERDAASGADRDAADAALLAFHEVVSLMQQQAIAFGIPLADLGLHAIHPEQDLL